MAKPPAARTALAVLTGVNMLNYIDRYIPAGALPLILAAFSVSDTKGGLLQSLIMFPYAIVSPLAGAMGDRRRRFGMAGGGVGTHLGWRAAVFVAGVPGLLLALALLAFRDPPRTGATLDPAHGARPPPGEPPTGRGQLLRFPSYLANVTAQTIYTFAIGGLATWMPA